MLLNNLIGAYLTREGKALPDFNRGGGLTRKAEVGAIDAEARTVELAFSSEIEGERWFGIEVLDHDTGSIRLDRLRDGGALLVDHDWSDQIGVVESVSIGADRRGRAVVRFGRSARADEVFQDVKDGIRKHVSVGYRVHGAKLSETRDGVDVYLINDWEPLEISLVSVPFDHTVGVGRSLEIPQEADAANTTQNAIVNNGDRATHSLSEEVRAMEKILRDASGNLVRAMVDAEGKITQVLEVLERAGADVAAAEKRALATEQSRTASILEMGEKYKCEQLARAAVKAGTSADAFRGEVLEFMNGRDASKGSERKSTPLGEMKDPSIGLSDAEVRKYSIFKAVRAMLPNATNADREAAAFEFECSTAAQRHLGKEAQGILIPEDVMGRAFNAGGAPNSPTGAQTGSGLVDTNLMTGSFIDLLRNKTTIMALGTSMGGLVGNVDVPKQTGGATAYWLGEGDDATEGTPTIGQLSLSPKTVGAYTDITRRLMMQSTPDAEGIVRRDLLNAMAQAIDYAGYYGSGTANQPRGLKNYTGINGVDFASAAAPTYAELVRMETEIAADNADIGQMGYAMNARMRGYLKTTTRFGTGTESVIWEPGNTVNGYRTEVTNQIATGDVFFGNFADLIIGLWGGLDLTVDTATLSKSGGTRIVVFQDVDFVLRRVESICYGSDTVA
jgi:HK97 family phage major capsid protein/HK97 family phage prohead protease